MPHTPSNLIHERRAFSRVEPARADESSPFGIAMGALTLAIANADRALRNQPALTSPLDINPVQAERYHAAGLEAVLRQHPALVLDSINAAADELRDLVDGVLAEPDAAVVTDPERMKDACAAWVRATLNAFRGGLAAQLPILRGGL